MTASRVPIQGRFYRFYNADLVDCPVCYSRKLVSVDYLCGHSFCYECAACWSYEAPKTGFVSCPTCRAEMPGARVKFGLADYCHTVQDLRQVLDTLPPQVLQQSTCSSKQEWLGEQILDLIHTGDVEVVKQVVELYGASFLKHNEATKMHSVSVLLPAVGDGHVELVRYLLGPEVQCDPNLGMFAGRKRPSSLLRGAEEIGGNQTRQEASASTTTSGPRHGLTSAATSTAAGSTIRGPAAPAPGAPAGTSTNSNAGGSSARGRGGPGAGSSLTTTGPSATAGVISLSGNNGTADQGGERPPVSFDPTPAFPLWQARKPVICNLLLNYGANPNLRNCNGAQLLHWLAWNATGLDLQVLAHLKALLFPYEVEGESCSHLSSRSSNDPVVVEQGPDSDANATSPTAAKRNPACASRSGDEKQDAEQQVSIADSSSATEEQRDSTPPGQDHVVAQPQDQQRAHQQPGSSGGGTTATQSVARGAEHQPGPAEMKVNNNIHSVDLNGLSHELSAQGQVFDTNFLQLLLWRTESKPRKPSEANQVAGPSREFLFKVIDLVHKKGGFDWNYAGGVALLEPRKCFYYWNEKQVKSRRSGNKDYREEKHSTPRRRPTNKGGFVTTTLKKRPGHRPAPEDDDHVVVEKGWPVRHSEQQDEEHTSTSEVDEEDRVSSCTRGTIPPTTTNGASLVRGPYAMCLGSSLLHACGLFLEDEVGSAVASYLLEKRKQCPAFRAQLDVNVRCEIRVMQDEATVKETILGWRPVVQALMQDAPETALVFLNLCDAAAAKAGPDEDQRRTTGESGSGTSSFVEEAVLVPESGGSPRTAGPADDAAGGEVPLEEVLLDAEGNKNNSTTSGRRGDRGAPDDEDAAQLVLDLHPDPGTKLGVLHVCGEISNPRKRVEIVRKLLHLDPGLAHQEARRTPVLVSFLETPLQVFARQHDVEVLKILVEEYYAGWIEAGAEGGDEHVVLRGESKSCRQSQLQEATRSENPEVDEEPFTSPSRTSSTEVKRKSSEVAASAAVPVVEVDTDNYTEVQQRLLQQGYCTSTSNVEQDGADSTVVFPLDGHHEGSPEVGLNVQPAVHLQTATRRTSRMKSAEGIITNEEAVELVHLAPAQLTASSPLRRRRTTTSTGTTSSSCSAPALQPQELQQTTAAGTTIKRTRSRISTGCSASRVLDFATVQLAIISAISYPHYTEAHEEQALETVQYLCGQFFRASSCSTGRGGGTSTCSKKKQAGRSSPTYDLFDLLTVPHPHHSALTPLHAAAAKGWVRMMMWLMESDERVAENQPAVVNRNFATPVVSVAVRAGRAEMVELLVEAYGADLEARSHGEFVDNDYLPSLPMEMQQSPSQPMAHLPSEKSFRLLYQACLSGRSFEMAAKLLYCYGVTTTDLSLAESFGALKEMVEDEKKTGAVDENGNNQVELSPREKRAVLDVASAYSYLGRLTWEHQYRSSPTAQVLGLASAEHHLDFKRIKQLLTLLTGETWETTPMGDTVLKTMASAPAPLAGRGTSHASSVGRTGQQQQHRIDVLENGAVVATTSSTTGTRTDDAVLTAYPAGQAESSSSSAYHLPMMYPDGTFYLAGRRYRSVVRPVQGEADGYQICVEEVSNDCPDLQEDYHGTRDGAFADCAHNAEEEDLGPAVAIDVPAEQTGTKVAGAKAAENDGKKSKSAPQHVSSCCCGGRKKRG
ncbi:unnamed protein product [Amoebophrya sp. A120]|nr:unnamed protein product [Amoebophrya sp. A120]|eukprot:GSA120T00005944001.1